MADTNQDVRFPLNSGRSGLRAVRSASDPKQFLSDFRQLWPASELRIGLSPCRCARNITVDGRRDRVRIIQRSGLYPDIIWIVGRVRKQRRPTLSAKLAGNGSPRVGACLIRPESLGALLKNKLCARDAVCGYEATARCTLTVSAMAIHCSMDFARGLIPHGSTKAAAGTFISHYNTVMRWSDSRGAYLNADRSAICKRLMVGKRVGLGSALPTHKSASAVS